MKQREIGSPPNIVITTLRVYFYIPTNVIARRAMPDVATLRLSREQNQARLNYAEAEQGRPKVNLIRHPEERSDVGIYRCL